MVTEYEDALAHYGKKGMQWGVRNEDGSVSKSKTSALAGLATLTALGAAAAAGTGNLPLAALNATGAVRGVAMLRNKVANPESDAERKFATALHKDDPEPTNPDHPIYSTDKQIHSGETSTARQWSDYRTADASVYRKFDTGEKAYALKDAPDLRFLSKNGKPVEITSLNAYKTEKLQHDDTIDLQGVIALVDEFDDSFAHWGVKGMKWGVRRDAAGGVGLSVGQNTPDAVRARETMAAIKAKGSLSAASDADLNHLVNRLNLEKRFADANPSGLDKRNDQLQKALKYGNTMNEAIKFTNSPAGILLRSALGMGKGKHVKPVNELLKAAGGKKKKSKAN